MTHRVVLDCVLLMSLMACAGAASSPKSEPSAPGTRQPDAGTWGIDGSLGALEEAGRLSPPADGSPPGIDAAASGAALAALDSYLAIPRAERTPLAQQAFAGVSLTRSDADSARQKLWDDFAAAVRSERAGEVGASESVERAIAINGQTLRYYLARRGAEPSGGRSLFISMHGGGNAPAATNDSQWRNQIALVNGYNPVDAVWVAPRAPVDDWNMWFVPGIDALFERLITDMIVFEGVNPNKVYLNGYSAGGDGVYQLGPRMGERWAGAGMSAGHPNAASPLSLRNVPFAIHVGGDDTAYQRNEKAREWGMRLDALAAQDPGGYLCQWQVHDGRPHWMELDDAVSIPFLQSHTRDPIPRKVVWEQAEVPRGTFYWLAVDADNRGQGYTIEAHYDERGVSVDRVVGVTRLSVRLSDAMLDLDAPVSISSGGQPLWFSRVSRTIGVLARTLEEREDPALMFASEVELTVR
jgi:poly(3-hydroxybutyrate) depolymerase